jgi:hypothetical protein
LDKAGGVALPTVVKAQCFFFDAPLERVISICESFGAARRTDYPWIWLVPPDGEAELWFHISVALWADAERIGLGSTITHEIIADLMWEEIQDWYRSIATAFGVGMEEAEKIVTQRSNVIVRSRASGQRGERALSDCVLALLAEADGLVWSGQLGWTAQALRDDPTLLRLCP